MNNTYEKSFRLGAVAYRTQSRDIATRKASEAEAMGHFDEAVRYQMEADHHEDVIKRYWREIMMLDKPRPHFYNTESMRRLGNAEWEMALPMGPKE